MISEFRALPDGDNGTTHKVPSRIISATVMRKPPLNTQDRTENPPPPPRPSRNAVLPRSSSPMILVADDDIGDRDGERDQAVSREHVHGSRRGLNMRARMDEAGYRTRENEIGTEYVRHTDAGTVRVVELPPLYDDLRE